MGQNKLVSFFASFLLLASTTIAAQENTKPTRHFRPHVSNSDAEDVTVWDVPAQAAPASRHDLLMMLAARVRQTELDCSHLVHDLFQRAGMDYDYAPSDTLFDGIPEFHRVYKPQPGDLVVWHGHVGIVVNPDDHSFISALRSGVKIAQYDSNYWKRKGTPRFLRYAESSSSPEIARSRTRYDSGD
ncbi:MAG TPA: NlpC/P60 family protein [Candidatus Angelobacter sp.]|nr:NlpC/P60 family protein [Candidatus Angelobacter sp.]